MVRTVQCFYIRATYTQVDISREEKRQIMAGNAPSQLGLVDRRQGDQRWKYCHKRKGCGSHGGRIGATFHKTSSNSGFCEEEADAVTLVVRRKSAWSQAADGMRQAQAQACRRQGGTETWIGTKTRNLARRVQRFVLGADCEAKIEQTPTSLCQVHASAQSLVRPAFT